MSPSGVLLEFQHGKQNLKNKWWFDLEDAKGKIQVPKNKKYDSSALSF